MKKLGLIGLLAMVLLSGCSAATNEVRGELNDAKDELKNVEDEVRNEVEKQMSVGDGEVTLLTPTIAQEDNILEFMVTDFDEEKTTFIYVANQKVMEEKLKNNQEYSIDIEGLEDAHPTDYKPKVQFFQTEDDSEIDEEVPEYTMFKEVRYVVE